MAGPRVNGSSFDDYLARWRDTSPQRALAWLFLSPRDRVRFCGLAALQQEWLKATREASEPQVAAAKLGWWREEIDRAGQGEGRHPLTCALFADARVRTVPMAYWTVAVDAALLESNHAPAPDFAAQRAAAAPLADAFAALENRLAFGEGATHERAAAVAAPGHLVANLRALAVEVRHARSPLPMNLLARHGLTTEALAQDGPARRAALHDYLGELERALAAAAGMDGPLTFLRRVQLQTDLRSLRAGLRAGDPLQGVQAGRGGVRDLLKIWRAARISRHNPPVEDSHATS